jgi:hypothetical protein
MADGANGYKEDGDETGSDGRAVHGVRFHLQHAARARSGHERMDSNERSVSTGPDGLIKNDTKQMDRRRVCLHLKLLMRRDPSNISG